MIGMDLIGEMRRAYFEPHRAIKRIVRRLSVSRATVRKVIRGQSRMPFVRAYFREIQELVFDGHDKALFYGGDIDPGGAVGSELTRERATTAKW